MKQKDSQGWQLKASDKMSCLTCSGSGRQIAISEAGQAIKIICLTCNGSGFAPVLVPMFRSKRWSNESQNQS